MENSENLEKLAGFLWTGMVRSVKRLFVSTVTCPNPRCRTVVDLTGIWQCHCGYTRYGNALGPCPSCHEFQRFIRCPSKRCGVSIDL